MDEKREFESKESCSDVEINVFRIDAFTEIEHSSFDCIMKIIQFELVFTYIEFLSFYYIIKSS